MPKFKGFLQRVYLARNAKIVADYNAKIKVKDIARANDLTEARIWQILWEARR